MPDYNDPFEQTGPVPIFDMAEVRRRRESASDPHALTPPTYPDGTATREHVEDRLDVAAVDECWQLIKDWQKYGGNDGALIIRLTGVLAARRADRLTEADPPT